MSTLTIVTIGAILALFILGLYVVLFDRGADGPGGGDRRRQEDRVTPPMVTVTNSSISITFDGLPQDREGAQLPPAEIPDDLDLRSDYDIFADRDSSAEQLRLAMASLIREGYVFYGRDGLPVTEDRIPEFAASIRRNREALARRATEAAAPEGVDVRDAEAENGFDMDGIARPDAEPQPGQPDRDGAQAGEASAPQEPRAKASAPQGQPSGLAELSEQVRRMKGRDGLPPAV